MPKFKYTSELEYRILLTIVNIYNIFLHWYDYAFCKVELYCFLFKIYFWKGVFMYVDVNRLLNYC